MVGGCNREIRLLWCGDVQTGSRLLRDEGHEVVLLDAGVSPQQLVAIAVQEDVELVAVADPELGSAVAGELEDVVVFWVTSEPGAS